MLKFDQHCSLSLTHTLSHPIILRNPLICPAWTRTLSNLPLVKSRHLQFIRLDQWGHHLQIPLQVAVISLNLSFFTKNIFVTGDSNHITADSSQNLQGQPQGDGSVPPSPQAHTSTGDFRNYF